LDEGLLNKIQELIEKGVGDIPRLEEIKERLEAGKILYQSDYDYIKEILSKYGLVDTADKPKEETSKSLSEYKTVSEIKKELGTATEKIESMENKLKEQEKTTASIKHYKSEGITLVLSIVVGLLGIMGVGHIYVGKVKRGIGILIGGILAWASFLIIYGVYGVLEGPQLSDMQLTVMVFGPFIIAAVAGITLFIWQILNSRKLCKEYNEHFEEHGKPPW